MAKRTFHQGFHFGTEAFQFAHGWLVVPFFLIRWINWCLAFYGMCNGWKTEGYPLFKLIQALHGWLDPNAMVPFAEYGSFRMVLPAIRLAICNWLQCKNSSQTNSDWSTTLSALHDCLALHHWIFSFGAKWKVTCMERAHQLSLHNLQDTVTASFVSIIQDLKYWMARWRCDPVSYCHGN